MRFFTLIVVSLIGVLKVTSQETIIYNDIVYNEFNVSKKLLCTTYDSIGKIAFDYRDKEYIRDVKERLGFFPTTSIAFSFEGNDYYIPIYDDLLMFDVLDTLKRGDVVMMEILFLKVGVNDSPPFAIVRSIFQYDDFAKYQNLIYKLGDNLKFTQE